MEQLAKLRRAKRFSWSSQKKQIAHNRYQEYFTSHILCDGQSFAWDTNQSTALLKPPMRFCFAILLWLAMFLVSDSYKEELTQLGLFVPVQVIYWIPLVYAFLGIFVHRITQIINPLSYAGISFRFTGTPAGFFREVIIIPCLLFAGVLTAVRYIDLSAVYLLGLADVLFFAMFAYSHYLLDKFILRHIRYADRYLLFDANLKDYLKLYLKAFLLLLLFAELVLITFYSLDALYTFNIDQFDIFFEVGFAVLLIGGFAYAAITVKVEHRTLLVNHVAIHGKRLNSSMQASEFFQQLCLVVKRFITSAGHQKLALTQHFLLYQLTNLSLMDDTCSKAS